MPPTTFGAAPLKGSWEAQLAEAEQMARNFNDACLPIFDKIYTRLGKMPKARRMAADKRLQQIFLRASDDYQGYLLMREEYDKALEIIERMEEELGDEEALNWKLHSVLALHQAGRDDEVLERMRPQPDLPVEEALDAWGSFATLLIAIGRLNEAEAALDHATALVEELIEEEEMHRIEIGYLAMQRAELALRRQAWEESVSWFNEAISWHDDYYARIRVIYQPMAVEGPPELALDLIREDMNTGMGRFFWRGVAHLRAGEEEKARQDWKKALPIEPDADETPPIYETVLASYYLGDPNRAGLSAVLQTLQEQDPENWGLMVLAGLGWAIHGNMTNAHSNLEIAMLLRRMSRPGGKYLPGEIWPHFRLLLAPEQLREFVQYFDVAMDLDDPTEVTENEMGNGEEANGEEERAEPEEMDSEEIN